MSIGTNGLHPAAAAYFKHQRLISGSGSEQALGLVERTLVVKHRPTKVELPRPVHRPVPCQVVLLLHWADGQVAGGNLHFLNVDASGPSWDHDHGVIFFTRHERRQSQHWIKGEYSPPKYPSKSLHAQIPCLADETTASGPTVSPVLKGVLALEELAGGVVSFTDAACVQGGLGAQNLVTAHRLSQEFAKSFILKSEELPEFLPGESTRYCFKILFTFWLWHYYS